MRMSNVLNELGDEVGLLKNKFAEARKELQTEDTDNHDKEKLMHQHPRSLAYTERKQVERCE